MSEVGLNHPDIGPLGDQAVAAGMAQAVWMDVEAFEADRRCDLFKRIWTQRMLMV